MTSLQKMKSQLSQIPCCNSKDVPAAKEFRHREAKVNGVEERKMWVILLKDRPADFPSVLLTAPPTLFLPTALAEQIADITERTDSFTLLLLGFLRAPDLFWWMNLSRNCYHASWRADATLACEPQEPSREQRPFQKQATCLSRPFNGQMRSIIHRWSSRQPVSACRLAPNSLLLSLLTGIVHGNVLLLQKNKKSTKNDSSAIFHGFCKVL